MKTAYELAMGWRHKDPPKTGEFVEAFYYQKTPPEVSVAWDETAKGWFDRRNHRYPEPTMWRPE